MQWSFMSDEMEFRAIRERKTKTGDTFLIVVVEDMEGYQNEISVRDENLFSRCRKLVKGQRYRFPVTVVATNQWQFARLDSGYAIQSVDAETGLTEEI